MPVDRNRVIYQSQGLFVSTGTASGFFFSSGNSGENFIRQIPRVQTVSDDQTINRQDVGQFGDLARIDQVILEAPTTNVNFEYLLVDGLAEHYLGFTTNGITSIISGILTKETDPRNYFVLQTPQGTDANGNMAVDSKRVRAFAQGSLSNYSIQADVGGFPRAQLSVEALNYRTYTGSTGLATPAINPSNGLSISGPIFTMPVGDSYTGADIVSALRPGDITLEIPNTYTAIGDIMSGAGSVHIQGFNLSIPLARTPLTRLGTTFDYAKEIQFPVNVTFTINAFQADIQNSSLNDVLCDDQPVDLRVKMRKPNCSGQGESAIILDVKRVKLQSQSHNTSIGDNAGTVDFNFSNQVGGPEDTANGVFFSGSF